MWHMGVYENRGHPNIVFRPPSSLIIKTTIRSLLSETPMLWVLASNLVGIYLVDCPASRFLPLMKLVGCHISLPIYVPPYISSCIYYHIF